MATVSVRYIVEDVDAALAFYGRLLGFHEVMHPAPTFAMMAREGLRLVLSAPGGGPGGGQAMDDGTLPEPGGWNRFSIEVADLDEIVDRLRHAGARFRTAIVDGVGGRQTIVEDPSGNPIELFQPLRDEARLGADGERSDHPEYAIRPIGQVESTLTDLREAPRQGPLGAPSAWLVIEPDMREGIRDLDVGAELLVLTWLHQSRRGELSTRPGDDPTGPGRGVQHTLTGTPQPDRSASGDCDRPRRGKAAGRTAGSHQRHTAGRHQARDPTRRALGRTHR